MALWGFLLTAAACTVFPHQRGVILVVTAVGSLVRGGRRRVAALGTAEEDDEAAREEGQGSSSSSGGGSLLEWRSVRCTIQNKRTGKVNKELLDGVWGSASPGRLLAIMGPSGAGKTTLLNVLAAQLPDSSSGGRTCLTGFISVNGVTLGKSKHRQAYIRQEDSFFSELTVRETLIFAAKLQLPGSMSEEEKEALVDNLLNSIGLAKVRDSRVGSNKVRGISGGEKKRLSVACQLLGDPSLVFADEPTTGLDAFQAEKVMETLRSLARDQGKTVICSIHQPRGSVYDMFDDIILMSEGKLVYSGPAKGEALKHFSAAGYPCPEHSNPAEHLADLASIDHSSPETEEASHARLASLVAFFLEQHPQPESADGIPKVDFEGGDGALVLTNGSAAALEEDKAGVEGAVSTRKKRAKGIGFVEMFKLLFSRAWKQTWRDKQTNFVRGAMNVTSALIFGSIFWRMGLSQASIQDRMGLLQVAAINTAMASLTKTLNIFPKERQLAQREIGTGAYSVGAYFTSKLAAELPIGALFPALFGTVMYPMTGLHKSLSRFLKFLVMSSVESFTASAMGLTIGCFAPSTEAAMALGPSTMTVFIVFGGYYVNADNTPFIFRWIPNFSLIRWAFQGLSANEFSGLRFAASQPGDLETGEQVLKRFSFDINGSTNGILSRALRKELGILAFWYWASLYLLQRTQAKYVPLLPPPPPVTEPAETN